MVRRLFETKVIGYLLTVGFTEVAPPEVDDNLRTAFLFEDSPELQEAINNFFDGTPIVNAQVYSYHLRRLNLIVSRNKKRGMQKLESHYMAGGEK